MLPNDNCPIRRNLVVTSLLFNVYFWGGGKITDSTIKFPMINVQFEHVTLLGYFAWLMLFFFWWRYWQEYSGKFWPEFRRKLGETAGQNKLLLWQLHGETGYYFFYKAKKMPGQQLAFQFMEHVPGVSKDEQGVYILYKIVKRGTEEKRQFEHVADGKQNMKFYLKGWKGVVSYSWVAWHSDEFANYVIPFLLFLSAILGAVFMKWVPYMMFKIYNIPLYI